MKTTRTLICILAAGATLGAAAPVFADSWHGRGYERHEYRGHDRYAYRDHHYAYRDYGRRNVVVVERPYVVQRSYVVQPPVFYSPPVMSYGPGPATLLGAAIGTFIDNER